MVKTKRIIDLRFIDVYILNFKYTIMNKYETYISDRLIFINDEYKYTFLKCYGIDYKNNVDVVCQHLHTGDVRVRKINVDQINFHFNRYAGIIFSYLNKHIPTYKIK